MRSAGTAARTLITGKNVTAARRLRERRVRLMAMACISGARECDGCMRCLPEPEPCPNCGSKDYKIRYIQDGDWIGCDDCIDEEL